MLLVRCFYIKNAACCSENYIFGKFDTFTKRLEKIIKLVELIDKSQGVENLRIEGIEEIAEQYKEIVDGLKKKNYDLLDFRRHEVQCNSFTDDTKNCIEKYTLYWKTRCYIDTAKRPATAL